MVGRHRVAEDRERARPPDVRDGIRLHPEAFEEGGLLDISRFRVPPIDPSRRRGNFVPEQVGRDEDGVEAAVRLRVGRGDEGVTDLREGRPDLFQVHGLTLAVAPDRLPRQVRVDASRQGECHDERRAHQEIRLDVLLDPSFEVAVS